MKYRAEANQPPLVFLLETALRRQLRFLSVRKILRRYSHTALEGITQQRGQKVCKQTYRELRIKPDYMAAPAC